MKLGHFLDKLDTSERYNIKVAVWVKEKTYTTKSPCGYIWSVYNVVRDASIWSSELDEYRDNTLETCFICDNGGLEFTVK